MSIKGDVLAQYLGHGDPALANYHRAWLDNMADVNGPDIVGLLANEVSYGAYGDHGGASEPVQRVPMVFWSASMTNPHSTDATFRTPDVMPTILRALGIQQAYPTDGTARALD